jgi:sortase A
MAITGHRDTFFRPLRNILQKDRIMLATLQGEYGYQVVSMSIVGPDDVEVLRASDNETLTLITCYPFTFLGPAPRRLIVRAERVE